MKNWLFKEIVKWRMHLYFFGLNFKQYFIRSAKYMHSMSTMGMGILLHTVYGKCVIQIQVHIHYDIQI